MNDQTVTPIPTAPTDANLQLLGALGQTIMADYSTTQQRIAEQSAQTEAKRLDLERHRLDIAAAQFANITGKDFTLKLLGAGLLAAVTLGGFFTQNFSVVTHALTLAAGVLAGVGISKKSS